MEDRVTVTMADGVADVRLVRADKMNALDAAMFEALVATSGGFPAKKACGRWFCPARAGPFAPASTWAVSPR